jgi:hypothetical protein
MRVFLVLILAAAIAPAGIITCFTYGSGFDFSTLSPDGQKIIVHDEGLVLLDYFDDCCKIEAPRPPVIPVNPWSPYNPPDPPASVPEASAVEYVSCGLALLGLALVFLRPRRA